MKILIIEDNTARMQYFSKWLENIDYDITYNVSDAIELIKNNNYDVIFWDYDLGVFIDNDNVIEVNSSMIINELEKNDLLNKLSNVRHIIHSNNQVSIEKLNNYLKNITNDIVVSKFDESTGTTWINNALKGKHERNISK